MRASRASWRRVRHSATCTRRSTPSESVRRRAASWRGNAPGRGDNALAAGITRHRARLVNAKPSKSLADLSKTRDADCLSIRQQNNAIGRRRRDRCAPAALRAPVLDTIRRTMLRHGATLVALLTFAVLGLASAEPIDPGGFRVLDGDTVAVAGVTYRLIGFDTPEQGSRAKCAGEAALAERATSRLRAIVAAGGLDLARVACACRAATEGTPSCNYGRLCAVLRSSGQDVAEIISARAWRIRSSAARHVARVVSHGASVPRSEFGSRLPCCAEARGRSAWRLSQFRVTSTNRMSCRLA